MIKFLLSLFRHTFVSLRFSVLSIFITFFIITTFSIIYLRSAFSNEELSFTALGLMQRISEAVLNELNAGLRPIEVESTFSAHLMNSDVLQPTLKELVPYTFYLVKMMPLVHAAYFANQRGDFIRSRKEKDGNISTEVILRTIPQTHFIYFRDRDGHIIKKEALPSTSYDPRARLWYLQAKNTKKTEWTDIYSFAADGQLGLTANSPVFDEHKQFMGAFGFDVSLNALTRFVKNASITANGYSFIVTLKEDLVAYPKKGPFANLKEIPATLINTHQTAIPLINDSLDMYKKTGKRELTIKFQGEDYLVTYQPVPQLAKQGWLIGVVTPKSDFVYFLQWLNLITMIICFFILFVGILIVSNLISYVIKPIKNLVKETEKIKRFELDDSDIEVHSKIKEIDALQKAIFSMKKGLEQFQKYVPKDLVHQLIESGKETNIGGERKKLVVFFSDIQNFTSIAEYMDPNRLMIQVCEYLDALTRIIIEEKGTIDKYIGDSIMAFWGAPLPEKTPCTHAAFAALRCEEKLEELNKAWEKQGLPSLITRIGIHFGDAIVGNLGSSERLNYTALGDTINLTSRLESVNKIYKTKILVSEPVYQVLKNKFILRMVDRVVIIGRTQTIMLYELLTDDEKKLSFNIHEYNAAFARGYEAYEQGKDNEAVSYFQECLRIYPEDTLSPIFIERCTSAK